MNYFEIACLAGFVFVRVWPTVEGYLGDKKFVVKLRLVQFLADLPAKAKMINMQAFSAFFGCTYCTQRGVTELPDISHTIFPYDEPADPALLRSPEDFVTGFQQATDSGAVYKGYKPVS